MLNAGKMSEIMELQKLSGMEKFSKLTVKQMLDREKLIELLDSLMVDDDCLSNAEIAEILVTKGVTVQKEAKLYWKPVKPGECNLTCSACDSHLGCREDSNYCPECGAKFVYPKAVSPKLSKGE